MTQFDDYNVGNLSKNKGGIMTYQAHEDEEGFETVWGVSKKNQLINYLCEVWTTSLGEVLL